VITTGARPFVPNIRGLSEAPFTANVNFFNLKTLPPQMVIMGAGVVALEMAQAFARFRSNVTVLIWSEELFAGRNVEAGRVIRGVLESEGVTFWSSVKVSQVDTIRPATICLLILHGSTNVVPSKFSSFLVDMLLFRLCNPVYCSV